MAAKALDIPPQALAEFKAGVVWAFVWAASAPEAFSIPAQSSVITDPSDGFR
jgi:hypothetical protein